MKIKFKNGTESTRWVAEMNEKNFRFDAAARLYREVGDEESANRCERMWKMTDIPDNLTPTPPQK